MAKKIVVIGGGYAGVLTAKKLLKKLKKEIKKDEVEITIIDKLPYHTLMTELHEVAFARTEREAIRVYLSKIFKGKKITIVTDTVSTIDYEKKTVVTKDTSNLDYDYLVEATGAVPTFFGVEGAQEHSYTLWSYKDAVDLHTKVLNHFELAEKETNEEKRKALLTFVVAGAGFTGVEVCGELNEWIKLTLLKNYPSINQDEVRVVIIDGMKRILNAFGEKASNKAHKYMNKKGIEVITESFITKVTKKQIFFGKDEVINTNMVIWTSGITCSPINSEGYEIQRGNRIPVDSNLQIVGQDDVYSLGDIMYYIPEGKECAVPQMVENCENAAPIVANNIAMKIKGESKLKDYNPAFHGAMACIGGRYGVAELEFSGRKIVLSSFFAMLVKHMINMIYFFQAVGITKVWHYIKDEFFFVRDRRSFVGGHLSAQGPSIYLVPLRIFLGIYWFKQGFGKVVHKLSGGWDAICDTSVFPGDVKDYGGVCRAVNPEGEVPFYVKNADAVPPSSIADQVEAAKTAATAGAQTITPDAVTSASGVAEAVPDVTTSASGVVETVADVATSASVPATGGDVVVETSTGFFQNLSDQLSTVGTVDGGDYGVGYDLHLLPDWFTDILTDVTTFFLGLFASFEWLMELMFDSAELILGVLLILGLFTSFAAVCITVLGVVISVGSFVSYGMIVEGLFFSIFSSIAMLGIGTRDYMPLSVDYYFMPWLRKKLNRRKK